MPHDMQEAEWMHSALNRLMANWGPFHTFWPLDHEQVKSRLSLLYAQGVRVEDATSAVLKERTA